MTKQKVLIIIAILLLAIFLLLLFFVQISSPPAVQQPIIATPTSFAPPQTTHIPLPTVTIGSPSLSPKSSPLSPYEKQLQKQSLITAMPVTGSGYTIEYFYTSDTFVVTITENPYAENRKKAEQWFTQQGVNDLSSIRILWTSHPYVQ